MSSEDKKIFPTAKGAPTLKDVAELIKGGSIKNIVVAVGAGISTSAGIPGWLRSQSLLRDMHCTVADNSFNADLFVSK
jgi:NAD-dependent SIR2 family protein deacetylase